MKKIKIFLFLLIVSFLFVKVNVYAVNKEEICSDLSDLYETIHRAKVYFYGSDYYLFELCKTNKPEDYENCKKASSTIDIIDKKLEKCTNVECIKSTIKQIKQNDLYSFSTKIYGNAQKGFSELDNAEKEVEVILQKIKNNTDYSNISSNLNNVKTNISNTKNQKSLIIPDLENFDKFLNNIKFNNDTQDYWDKQKNRAISSSSELKKVSNNLKPIWEDSQSGQSGHLRKILDNISSTIQTLKCNEISVSDSGISSIITILTNIIKFAFSILMVLGSLLLIILGTLMISSGKSKYRVMGQEVDARQAFIYLVLGIVLLLLSSFIPNLIKSFIEYSK